MRKSKRQDRLSVTFFPHHISLAPAGWPK